MPLPQFSSDRFTQDAGLRVTVQLPHPSMQIVITAVQKVDPLTYGDYDRVSYVTSPGQQYFHALGTGHNAPTEDTVSVDCVELSFFIASDVQRLKAVLEAIYWAHPYEEPVIFVQDCLRTLHVRGCDEDNPNRFWNQDTPDWVPAEHQ